MGYGTGGGVAKMRNLGISTIEKINHLAVLCEHFSKYFIIIGAMVGLFQMKGLAKGVA